MFLLKSTRSLGGSRFMQRLYKSRNINDKIIFFVKKNFTSHNRYHKTQQTKFTHIGKIQFNLKIPKWYFFCTDIFSLKTKFAAVFKNATGAYFAAPLVEAIKLGSKVSWLRGAYKKFFFLSVGVIARLRFLKLATLVSNVGYNSPTWATSRGTYAKVRLVRPKSVTIILPSGIWLELTRNITGIVGRNAGSKNYKEVLGKASAQKYNLKRIIVRSCAKNPVDHPNGGRTRGKRLFKTPWGHPAKRNK